MDACAQLAPAHDGGTGKFPRRRVCLRVGHVLGDEKVPRVDQFLGREPERRACGTLRAGITVKRGPEMDYDDAATAVLATLVGLGALGMAGYQIYLLVKGFSWGRKVVK